MFWKRPRRRFSDDNRYWGIFTLGVSGGRRFGVVIDSGGEDDFGCYVKFYFGKYTLLVEVPGVVGPYRVKRFANWDAATVERLGRNFYFDVFRREFGFYFFEGYLHVYFGAQTGDSSTDMGRGFLLPWCNWRFICTRWYGIDGELLRVSSGDWRGDSDFKESMPRVFFEVDDFDGRRVIAKTCIEEREWRFGVGWFRWLGWFCGPKVRRSLDIEFSDEVGPDKGSWKGGVLGTGIDMLPGELHSGAFERFCGLGCESRGGKYMVRFVGLFPAE